MGRYFFKDCLSPFLCSGTTFAFFHSEGNAQLSRQDLKISWKGGKTELPHIFSILVLILSYSGHIWIKVFYYFGNIGSGNWDWWKPFGYFMLILAGISLELSIRVHCWLKKVLNSSPLSLKFEINLSLWNSGRIQSIFLLTRKVFKSDQ